MTGIFPYVAREDSGEPPGVLGKGPFRVLVVRELERGLEDDPVGVVGLPYDEGRYDSRPGPSRQLEGARGEPRLSPEEVHHGPPRAVSPVKGYGHRLVPPEGLVKGP